MTEIRPTYYAGGDFTYEFEILGCGFDMLPSDVVGFPMTSNDDPLRYRNADAPSAVMLLVERSNTRIVMRASEEAHHGLTSIGGLVSNDRSIVYWENDTNPLP